MISSTDEATSAALAIWLSLAKNVLVCRDMNRLVWYLSSIDPGRKQSRQTLFLFIKIIKRPVLQRHLPFFLGV